MGILNPQHLIFVSLKIGLLFLLKDTNIDQTIKAIPFFNTKFSDYSRVEEAIYFIGQNADPYQVEHIFQKPILVYLLNILKNIPGAITGLFVLCDLIIAELISNINFIHSKFFGIITRWTCIFEFTFGLLSVYNYSKKNTLLGSIMLGIALYLNPIMLMLLVPIFVAPSLHNQSIQPYILSLITAIITTLTLLGISFILTGGSYQFLINAYLHSYSPVLFQPSIGLMWTLFSGMFNKFQEMYHLVFFFLPLCHILPLIKIFSKSVKENSFTTGLYGFIAGISLFIGYYHFSYITVYELVIIAFLLFSAYEYIVEIKIILVLTIAPLIILGLTAMLGKFWFYGLTGNPNFMFFQTFVSYIFFIILVTEALKGLVFQKKNQLKQIQDQQDQLQNETQSKEESKKNQ